MPGPYVAHLFRAFSDNTAPALSTGWTEVWYPKAGSLAEAGSLADSLNSIESRMFPPSVSFPIIKVSDLTIRGDVLLVYPKDTAGTYSTVPGPPSSTCDPNVALKYTLTVADARSRSVHYFRGLPVKLINAVAPIHITTDNEFGQVLADIFAEVSASFQIVRKSKDKPPVFTPVAITGVEFPPVGTPRELAIRRSGRPFALRRGRRPV